MFNRASRNAQAQLCAQFPAPHTRSQNDILRLVRAVRCFDFVNAPAFNFEIKNFDTLFDLSAVLSGCCCNRLTQARRVDMAIRGDEGSAEDFCLVNVGEEVFGLCRSDHAHLKIKTARHGAKSLRFEHPVLRGGQPERPYLFPVEGQASLFFKPVIHFDRLFQHPRGVPRRP